MDRENIFTFTKSHLDESCVKEAWSLEKERRKTLSFSLLEVVSFTPLSSHFLCFLAFTYWMKVFMCMILHTSTLLEFHFNELCDVWLMKKFAIGFSLSHSFFLWSKASWKSNLFLETPKILVWSKHTMRLLKKWFWNCCS